MALSISEFGQKIKQKYPQYNDLGDYELGDKMLQKYPQYSDMVDSSLEGETKGAAKFFRPFMRGLEKELVPFSEKTGQKIIPGEYEQKEGEEGLVSKLGYGAGFVAGSLPSLALTGGVVKVASKAPKIAKVLQTLSKGGKVAKFTAKHAPSATQFGLLGALQETEEEPFSLEGLTERAKTTGEYAATGVAFDAILAPIFGKAWRKLFPKKEQAQAAVEAVTGKQKLLPPPKKKPLIVGKEPVTKASIKDEITNIESQLPRHELETIQAVKGVEKWADKKYLSELQNLVEQEGYVIKPQGTRPPRVLRKFETEQPNVIEGVSSPGSILKNKKTVTSEAETVIDSEIANTTVSKVIKTGGEYVPTESKLTTEAIEGAEETALKRGKYAGSINLDKLNISPQAKEKIRKVISFLQKEGGVSSEQEALELAIGNDMVFRALSKDDLIKLKPFLQEFRTKSLSQLKSKQGILQFVEDVRKLDQVASFFGRGLEAFKTSVDPLEGQLKRQILERIAKTQATAKQIAEAASKVNFDDPKQVIVFYRQFVKPTWGEILNEYRYINLLSSPKTHSVNFFSNFLQATVLDPATKLYSGGIDYIGSSLTGKARQHYASEVPAYYRGMFNSTGDAFREFAAVMKGQRFVERPDITKMPTNWAGFKYLGSFSKIPNLLEASDIFWRTLIAGGEKEAIALNAFKRGIKVPLDQLEKEAATRANYYLFRESAQAAKEKGQGYLLSGIDFFTNKLYSLRGTIEIKGKEIPNPVAWFVPFVRTPINILKQGIEYSPLGFATTLGAKNATEQLAKAFLGSTVFAGAAWLVNATDSTWAAPQGEEAKKEFFAAGRQPYSIKIGDKWIGFSRLGPLAYPIALASAMKYYWRDDPKRFTASTSTKVVNNALAYMRFFTDQSYVQGIADLVDIATFRSEKVVPGLIDVGQQAVPLTSLLGWVSRIIDPVYRRAGKGGIPYSEIATEKIRQDLPFFSKKVPPYVDPFGQPSKRDFPFLNALSPVNIGQEKEGHEQLYKIGEQERAQNAISNEISKILDDESLPFETKLERLERLKEVLNRNLGK